MSRDRLLGTWDVTMRHAAMTDPVSARQRYAWVLDGAYLQLTWTYDHPDFPDALALLTPEQMYYFDVRGVTRVFDLRFDDDGYVMTHPDPAFAQRFTARFDGPDVIETTGEYSDDGGKTWQHDFTTTSVRVG
jgi:hypothetical protein